MQSTTGRTERNQKIELTLRNGSILTLSVVLLVVILAFTAFSIDVGAITLTKSQMSNAADSAALAASQDLISAWGPGASSNASTVEQLARASAVDVASKNEMLLRSPT
ncbi:MAG: pilus assembly protein TadG-related protein, partial [Planctomycetaceae bacterium]